MATGCFWLNAKPEGRSVPRAEAEGWGVLKDANGAGLTSWRSQRADS
jgi:hypothetical protein